RRPRRIREGSPSPEREPDHDHPGKGQASHAFVLRESESGGDYIHAMRTFRAVTVVVLATLLAARAEAAGPTRAEAEAALRKTGREGEADLPRLAGSAEAVLLAIASDQAAEGPLRARAIAALAYARTARVHVFLENLVLKKGTSSDGTDRLLLRRAI